jgi:hypothetical protein
MEIRHGGSSHGRAKPAWIGQRIITIGAINQVNVDMFKVFDRCVVNDRRGIGAPLRA